MECQLRELSTGRCATTKALEHTGNDPDQKHLARRSFRLDRIQTSKHGLDVDRERAAEAAIPKSCAQAVG